MSAFPRRQPPRGRYRGNHADMAAGRRHRRRCLHQTHPPRLARGWRGSGHRSCRAERGPRQHEAWTRHSKTHSPCTRRTGGRRRSGRFWDSCTVPRASRTASAPALWALPAALLGGLLQRSRGFGHTCQVTGSTRTRRLSDSAWDAILEVVAGMGAFRGPRSRWARSQCASPASTWCGCWRGRRATPARR